LKQSEDECEDDRGGDRAPGHGQEQRDDLQAEQPDIVQSRTPARQVERMRNDAQEQEVPELVAIGEEAAEFELIARTRALKLSEDECEDDRGGDRAPGHGQEQRDDLQAEQPDIVQSRTPARQVERMRNDAQEQEVPELVAIGEEAAEFELIARTRAQKLR